MTPEEQAVFEQWLERHATLDELSLPFDEQVKAHILWLSGTEHTDLSQALFPEEDWMQ